MAQRLGFRARGSFSRASELDACGAFGGGIREHSMVSQYGTREGEHIRQALLKGPPMMLRQCDATEGVCIPETLHFNGNDKTERGPGSIRVHRWYIITRPYGFCGTCS